MITLTFQIQERGKQKQISMRQQAANKSKEHPRMISSLISYIYSLFTSYAYSLLGQQQSISTSISNLSTRDRDSLLCEVSDCLHWHLSGVGDVGLGSSLEDGNTSSDGIESDLDELDAVLDQCRTSLEKFEKKERFVSIRIQRYRGLLDQRSSNYQIDSDISNDSDQFQLVESGSENQTQSIQEKYSQDELALQSVEQVHMNLIAEIEVLRRRICDLEEKQRSYVAMREECTEFVLAAADA